VPCGAVPELPSVSFHRSRANRGGLRASREPCSNWSRKKGNIRCLNARLSRGLELEASHATAAQPLKPMDGSGGGEATLQWARLGRRGVWPDPGARSRNPTFCRGGEFGPPFHSIHKAHDPAYLLLTYLHLFLQLSLRLFAIDSFRGTLQLGRVVYNLSKSFAPLAVSPSPVRALSPCRRHSLAMSRAS
jgi:hypothetical protein